MKNKICNTCKWWQEQDRDGGDYDSGLMNPYDMDTGKPMALLFKVRYCNNPKITFYERPVEPDGATVIDGSMYKANLVTGPEFGCVLWEGLKRAVFRTSDDEQPHHTFPYRSLEIEGA